MKVKKGDTVQIISGKDRGATGKVLQAYPERGKVLVEGVNRVKRHTKMETSARGSQSGGILTQEAPLDVSKVMVVAGGKPTRVGYRLDEVTDEDGRVHRTRTRISRRTGEDI